MSLIITAPDNTWYNASRRSFLSGSAAFQIKEDPSKVKVIEVEDDPVDLSNFLGDLGLDNTHRDAATEGEIASYLTSHGWWLQIYGGQAGDGLTLGRYGFSYEQVYSRRELARNGEYSITDKVERIARDKGYDPDDLDDALRRLNVTGFRYIRSDAVSSPATIQSVDISST